MAAIEAMGMMDNSDDIGLVFPSPRFLRGLKFLVRARSSFVGAKRAGLDLEIRDLTILFTSHFSSSCDID